jgi:hexokinase
MKGVFRLRVDKGGIRFRVCFVCVLFGFLLHHRYYVAVGVDEGGIRLRVDKGGIRFRVCFVCVL